MEFEEQALLRHTGYVLLESGGDSESERSDGAVWVSEGGAVRGAELANTGAGSKTDATTSKMNATITETDIITSKTDATTSETDATTSEVDTTTHLQLQLPIWII